MLSQVQSNKAKCSQTKASETMSQNKHFLFLSCLSQEFCQSEGELTYVLYKDAIPGVTAVGHGGGSIILARGSIFTIRWPFLIPPFSSPSSAVLVTGQCSLLTKLRDDLRRCTSDYSGQGRRFQPWPAPQWPSRSFSSRKSCSESTSKALISMKNFTPHIFPGWSWNISEHLECFGSQEALAMY